MEYTKHSFFFAGYLRKELRPCLDPRMPMALWCFRISYVYFPPYGFVWKGLPQLLYFFHTTAIIWDNWQILGKNTLESYHHVTNAPQLFRIPASIFRRSKITLCWWHISHFVDPIIFLFLRRFGSLNPPQWLNLMIWWHLSLMVKPPCETPWFMAKSPHFWEKSLQFGGWNPLFLVVNPEKSIYPLVN